MAIKRFLQICCIVNDVEKTKQVLRDEYGFTNWAPKEDFGGPVTDYQINGEPAVLNNKAEFCTAFGIEWEFIEPKSGPLKPWLDEHGPGVHHFAVLTDDSYEEFGAKAKRLTGKDVWLHGTAPSVGMDYSYYDLTSVIGMFLEVYNEDRPHPSGFNMDAQPDPPLE